LTNTGDQTNQESAGAPESAPASFRKDYHVQIKSHHCPRGYHDINNAMVDVLQDLLPELRRALTARELARAEHRLLAAQAQVDQLRAKTHAKAASGNRSLPLPDHEVKP
jgi:hypothetical protein